MFCVECGREGPTYEGLCGPCYLDRHRFAHIDEKVDLYRCGHCQEFCIDGEWTQIDSLEEAVSQAAVRALRVREDVSVQDIQVSIHPQDGSNLLVHLTLEMGFQDLEKTEELETKVRVKGTSCPRCSRIKADYYESILQIRSRDRSLGQEEKDEILDHIGSRLEEESRDNRDLFVSKLKELHGGLDVYLSSSHMGKTLSRELAAMYGGQLKESSTLVGQKEGKEVYRITFLVRLPAYRPGDIISHGARMYQVGGVGAKSTRLVDLVTHEASRVENTDLLDVMVRGHGSDIDEAVVVSESEGEMQLLHPTSYRMVEVRKPPGYRGEGDTVRVFTREGEVFLLPNRG
ncbi:MAG: 60S ribosomal export protein NMD3 [Thermoplasmatota archaeon]